MTIFLFLSIYILLTNSKYVISGATKGLLLWYSNILPLLLPFILISSIITTNLSYKYSSKQKNNLYYIFIIIILGLLCGFPIGAKTTAEFVKNKNIDKTLGNIIIIICNNPSPMFICGFISNKILHNSLNMSKIYLFILLPQIIIIFALILLSNISLKLKEKFFINSTNNIDKIICKITDKKTNNTNITYTSSSTSPDIITKSIEQITHIGLFIMLCSIIVEIINYNKYIPSTMKSIISSITEITNGCKYINTINSISTNKKIALILSLTSFGGICSILQTYQVINKTKLSIIKYSIFKALCATGTYYLTLLLI